MSSKAGTVGPAAKSADVSRISEALGHHYFEKFNQYGPTSRGVDWGPDEARLMLRYEKMLAVVVPSGDGRPSLLDVGCGFGGLAIHAAQRPLPLNYTGLDIAANMIDWAKEHVPEGHFIHNDILSHDFSSRFEYVVCNGILTQKLDVPGLEMDRFATDLIRKMFSLCTIGIAFNIMSTKVNYYANNLYYRNPTEILAWCLSELSPHVRIDHAYPLHEYTTYVYRDPI